MTPTTGGPLRVESLRDPDQGGLAVRHAELPARARELHRAVLRAFLATGNAPHHGDLPGSPGIEVDETLRRLTEVDLVQSDIDGRIVVAYPFSGRPTGHTATLGDGPVLHAMCAIDALGIPLMAGRDGVIVSSDPGDGHPIRVERRGDTWRWTPHDAAVLLAQSNRCGPAADCLCPTVTFHTSRRHAEDHLRVRPELTGVVLDRAQAIDVARRSFSALLAPQTVPVETVVVELLYTEGCPNAAAYLPRLGELMAAAGVLEPVRVRVITDPDDAQRERFLGSPTIRVNGLDADPAAEKRQDYGLSCRLYAGPDGLRGTPLDEWVLARLRPNPADNPNR